MDTKNMFAVIETGGKQYKVISGQKVKVEKLNVKKGDNFSFEKVLLRVSGDSVEIGDPYLKQPVEAKVLGEGRDKKKIVFRYHSKTRYRKKKGHRQHYTEIEITKI